MNALRLPAEWENQSAVLLAWPHEGTDWADHLDEVSETFAGIIAAIARFEPVLLCVPNGEVQGKATALLLGHGVDLSRILFAQVAYDDTWLRDSGPITLVGAEGPVLLDFRFNGWGGKYDASRDDELVHNLYKAGFLKAARRERLDFELEGGAIDTDGEGTLLTTWRCLHRRHPGMSREGLAAALSRYLQQERILWLESGYLEGDDTDAHVDTLARFAAADAIVYQGCDDPRDSHYGELSRMREELAAFRTAKGLPYRLIELPWPGPILEQGRRLAASYANFLAVNGAVLLPVYNDPADSRAAAALAQAFPGREVVCLPCRPLIRQNGSLHCLTMQLPEGVFHG